MFRAVGSITIDRIHALVGCLQNGHNLKHLPEFEKSDIPDNLLSDILYQSEKQFCNSCLFAEICQHRKLPCVVISKKKGHWERDVMTKQYPQVIEDAIKRLQSDIGPSGYFGGVIKWFSDDVAKENGFEKACAILFCLQEGEPTNSQICAIEGEPITNSVILKKVLQKYQITGKTITVEIKYPYQNPTKKSLTLKDPHNTAEYLFSQMPYVGEKNDGWIYRSPEEMTNSINCIKKNL